MKHINCFDFSGLYEDYAHRREDLPGDGLLYHRIDCTDIRGCGRYCDPAAREEIIRRIREAVSFDGDGAGGRSVSLIDSGNYHFMSRLLTSRLQRPYQMVLYDHHPDMRASAFADAPDDPESGLLSCGGWVRDALLFDPYLKGVVMRGVDAALCEEERSALEERLLSALWTEPDASLPVYLSVDKDVLGDTEVVTNWDQGDMTLDALCADIRRLVSSHEILGADICGAPEVRAGRGALVRNRDCDAAILRVIFEGL
ncbi:MAG: arginase [Lachnospiraceae bacterium]|nr:arginase [Lachnospiraceae bacterium]